MLLAVVSGILVYDGRPAPSVTRWERETLTARRLAEARQALVAWSVAAPRGRGAARRAAVPGS